MGRKGDHWWIGFDSGEFELNVESGELRKSDADEAERLPPQPRGCCSGSGNAAAPSSRVRRFASDCGVTRISMATRAWTSACVSFAWRSLISVLSPICAEHAAAVLSAGSCRHAGWRRSRARGATRGSPAMDTGGDRFLLVAVMLRRILCVQSNRDTPRVRIAIMPFEASIAAVDRRGVGDDRRRLGGRGRTDHDSRVWKI